VSDRLYLSCWLANGEQSKILSQFEELLTLFPFSKLSKHGQVVRVYAIEQAEPPLIEREFPNGAAAGAIIDSAREFLQPDCSIQLEGFWDLWQFDGEWKLAPAAVTLCAFGPDFDNDLGDQLRIEFGLDSRFLPQPQIPQSVNMVQSNIRSLLHLVSDVERELDLERRQLWSESGVNFAEVLAQSLQSVN
jgi:hypothetical protein